MTNRGWAEGNHDTPARMFRVDTEEMLAPGREIALVCRSLRGGAEPQLPIACRRALRRSGHGAAGGASICQVSECLHAGAGEGMLMLLYEDTVPVLALWRTEMALR